MIWKLAEIHRCMDCPRRQRVDGGLVCLNVMTYNATQYRKVINPNTIPKWCPLSDAVSKDNSCHSCDTFERQDRRYSWGTCSNKKAHKIFGFKGKDEYHKTGFCSCHSNYEGE